jgi:hypothetical protein
MTAETAGWIGWVATTMTVSSYFFHNQITLRRVQAVAALLWISYGVAISARPIIAANVIVTTVAFWSTWRESRRLAQVPAENDQAGPPRG